MISVLSTMPRTLALSRTSVGVLVSGLVKPIPGFVRVIQATLAQGASI